MGFLLQHWGASWKVGVTQVLIFLTKRCLGIIFTVYFEYKCIFCEFSAYIEWNFLPL